MTYLAKQLTKDFAAAISKQFLLAAPLFSQIRLDTSYIPEWGEGVNPFAAHYKYELFDTVHDASVSGRDITVSVPYVAHRVPFRASFELTKDDESKLSSEPEANFELLGPRVRSTAFALAGSVERSLLTGNPRSTGESLSDDLVGLFYGELAELWPSGRASSVINYQTTVDAKEVTRMAMGLMSRGQIAVCEERTLRRWKECLPEGTTASRFCPDHSVALLDLSSVHAKQLYLDDGSDYPGNGLLGKDVTVHVKIFGGKVHLSCLLATCFTTPERYTLLINVPWEDGFAEIRDHATGNISLGKALDPR